MEIKQPEKSDFSKAQEGDDRLGFEFDEIPFQGFSQTTKENLVRWGLDQSLVLKFFRFNIAFSDLESQKFLQDLLNSNQFQGALPGLAARSKKCNKVSFSKLRVTMLNMNFLDSLEEAGLVKKGGRIVPTFGEVIHSIEIVNLIRDAWVNEDGEHFAVFDEDMRRELLVQLFNLLVIGGVLNQYDDLIEPYRETLKEIYKEIVSVKKDGSNGAIYCESSAYLVTRINVRIFARF